VEPRRMPAPVFNKRKEATRRGFVGLWGTNSIGISHKPCQIGLCSTSVLCLYYGVKPSFTYQWVRSFRCSRLTLLTMNYYVTCACLLSSWGQSFALWSRGGSALLRVDLPDPNTYK